MAINDKLNRIKEIKEDIKQALIDKGVEVTDEDSFASYADKITNIPMEGGDPYYEDLYNLRTSNGTNMSGLFARMSGDNLDLSKLDVSKCTNMEYIFDQNNCNNIYCSGWDVSNVGKADYMFCNCSANIQATDWDTSKWTSFYYLFSNFRGSIDISNWNTENITNAQYMFNGATLTNIKGISNLKLPKVDSLQRLFYQASGEFPDLSNWDISNVTDMQYLFGFSNFKKIDLTGWKTSRVTNMSSTFYYLSNLTDLIIPDWDMTSVTNSSSFLYNASKLSYVDLSRSNDLTISKITSFLPTKTLATYGEIHIPADSSQEVIDALIDKYWQPIGPSITPTSFEIVSELDEVLLNGRTKVHGGSCEPWYASIGDIEFISSDESIATVNDNGEINALSIGSVEIYARLKDNPEVVSNTITISIVESYSNPYEIKFKVSMTPHNNAQIEVNNKGVYLRNMDYNKHTGVYTYDAGSSITYIRFGYNAHIYESNINDIIKFDFNSNNITSLEGIFSSSTFTNLDFITTWETNNVTNISSAFQNCALLKSLDLSTWDTSNINSMHGTFYSCTSLEYLNLSSWDTSNMGYSNVFTDVPSTCQIYVGPNWTLTESDCNFTGTFIRINPEYYTEYSIDSSTATFNMRSIDSINSGAYLPELSNGYDAVLLTLNDGSITTDLNTEANQVSSIKIYYPEETSYVKFANTKVKEVNHLNGSNITDCTGMFTNCVYLEKADLTSLDSTKVTVDTTMFEGVNTGAEVTFNDSWDIPESDMGRIDPTSVNVTVHYYNPNGEYGCGEWISFNKVDDASYGTGSDFGLEDDFGRYTQLELDYNLPYNVSASFQGVSFAEGQFTFTKDKELWTIYGDSTIYERRPEIPSGDQTEYYVEYTINKGNSEPLNTSYMYNDILHYAYLPTIKNIGDSDFHINYDGIEILLTDGSTTNDLTVDNRNVEKIKITYNADTTAMCFRGRTGSEGMGHNVKNINYINMNNFTDASYMFNACEYLEAIDDSVVITNKVTNAYSMFYGCKNLPTLDVSNWDTSNVTDMRYMFQNCYRLELTGLTNWNTGNVTRMNYMFQECRKLVAPNISNWNVGNVKNMNSMFSFCTGLTSIDLSSWQVTNSSSMEIPALFRGCSKLQSVNLTGWATGKMPSHSSDMIFEDVPSTCVITVSNDLWTFTESQTDFTGTFTRV